MYVRTGIHTYIHAYIHVHVYTVHTYIHTYRISLIRSRGYYLFQALTRRLYKGGDYDSQLESCIIASLLPRSHDNGHQLELVCAL